MDITKRIYPAKVLLFGEYTVTTGGQALAIPYPRFKAQWVADNRNFSLLQEFYSFLKVKQFSFLDMQHLRKLEEEERGLDCDIPIGYGLGSSGAITAAVYESICVSREEKSLMEIKRELALMENFYHGSSSGTDPLVSLLSRPLIVDEQSIHSPEIKLTGEFQDWKMYLYDTGQKRASGDFIQHFTEQLKRESFYNNFIVPVKDLVRSIIPDYINKKMSFLKMFRQISMLQYEFMQLMIIDSVNSLWYQGLQSEKYYFKLCGAGGGGMYIVLGKEKDIQHLSHRLIPL